VTGTLADEDGVTGASPTYLWSTGATTSAITLGQSDVGTTPSVVISYQDDQSESNTITLTAADDVDNVNDAGSGLSISSDGDAADPDEDDTLSVTGTLADEDGVTGASPTYLWSTGATTSAITLGQSDVGTTPSVVISYQDDQSESNTISLTAADDVDNVNDAPTGTVIISGTVAEDSTLTASNDLADEDGIGSITYTWSTGATGSTLLLTQSHVGSAITVTASYIDAYTYSESVTSSATAAVANTNDAPTGTVTISGTAAEDSTLTASNDLADEDGI
ncbi:uncharacterized protein METZ01_LOCUS228440, partial [marine metagenome]